MAIAYRMATSRNAGSSLRNNGRSHIVVSHIEHKDYPRSYSNMYSGAILGWDESRYIAVANDIALLKVKTPFQFDESCQPIGLFNKSEEVGAGVDALVTGWTIINGSEHLTTRIVQTLDMNICDKLYESIGGVSAGQICASYPGAPGKKDCVGISGGPLVVNGRLAGILSWGNGCVKARYPGVYTEIAYYRSWIDSVIYENAAH